MKSARDPAGRTGNFYENGFSFGKNWKRYLSHVSSEKIASAKISLERFAGSVNISNKSFLDVGCGSGIFSYAAYELGANRIVSFDIDPWSVACCKTMRAKAGDPQNWTVLRGSVLDEGFVQRIEEFDLVYAWGSLHHTGSMWQAIERTAKKVKKDGILYLSIYNKVGGPFGSGVWLRIKKTYNSTNPIGKVGMESVFLYLYLLRNYPELIFRKGLARGMDLLTGVTDWVGGYPYEFATADEIVGFMSRRFPSFRLVRVALTTSLATNSFLWRNSNQSH
jgi:2-polyprenyl-6-hydroxyphenyl methylase/3-demethylubiquinone-9 3-methyltransferase